MATARDKFFRQRVLTKLFPSEEDSDIDDNDDDDDDGDLETTSQSSVRTVKQDSPEIPTESGKRKLSDVEDINFPRRKVSSWDEQATPSLPSRLIGVEKLVSLPESLSTAPENREEPKDEKSREHVARGTGSDLSKSSEQVCKLSKNQKRKLKKKRHKERIRSSGVNKTSPAPKEFTYDPG